MNALPVEIRAQTFSFLENDPHTLLAGRSVCKAWKQEIDKTLEILWGRLSPLPSLRTLNLPSSYQGVENYAFLFTALEQRLGTISTELSFSHVQALGENLETANTALQLVWGKIRHQLLEKGIEDVLGETAPEEQIRSWMNSHPEVLRQITQLNLSRLNLRVLPYELTKLPSLGSLEAPHNALTTLPDWIGSFQNLHLLNVAHNHLTHLPDSLGNLRTLQGLLIHHNQLQALPDAIYLLQQLSILWAEHNELSSLPEHFGELTQLSMLFLHHNRLSHLPKSFPYCSHRIFLQDNPLVGEPLPWSFYFHYVATQKAGAERRVWNLPPSLTISRFYVALFYLLHPIIIAFNYIK